MRLTWMPGLPESRAPLYERLVVALEQDIAAGVLEEGVRLPPHRDLAYALGVGVGTVTKAYAEAERRGLITAHVGRGSFVAGADGRGAFALSIAPAAGAIDLARNIPPVGPARRRFAEAVAQLTRQPDLLDVLTYALPDGLERHRRAAVRWLRDRHGLESVAADDLVITNGAQQAIALALGAACRSGDTLLCEAATFHGMRAYAKHAGLTLRGVAMDDEGLSPEALDRAAAATGARALYTIPTLQNPTGRTMSLGRRRDIVSVARKRGLAIIEDDVYAAYARGWGETVALRDLAPDITFHASSVSKTLSPGLRVGFLAAPDAAWRDAVLRAVRALAYAAPALPALLVTLWIEEGAADAIADEVLAEVQARAALARALLAPDAPSAPACLHMWLAMGELQAERVAGRALRAGVEVTPPAAALVDSSQVSGLRLCIGAPPDLGTLERALRVVADALSSDDEAPARAVV
ncbi:MAG: aminotransferase class I/II-fold pyridoxal phosphate-dependent enzyme [Alphaproteobacteria bacterium]|nr:aminotransferase class I/II-fold pyridoxal phosphate-dependent enzyme [Alphaproteobacteria bacterium]